METLWLLSYKFAEKNAYDAANPIGWNHFLRDDGNTSVPDGEPYRPDPSDDDEEGLKK
jgi:hypothetical protein